jgi:archaetidylinositol phosphate synthase
MADQVREHRSVLAAAEKRLLVAMAQRLPRWVTSDQLTLAALLSMGAAGAGYALSRWEPGFLWVPIFALVVNWFGDSLDGTLARVRRTERPRYGFYVDHVVDIVGISALIAGLAVSPHMSPVIALALLVAYLLVSAEVFLATAVHGIFRMSFAGVGPTELRIILIAGTFALFGNPQVGLGAIGSFRLFDVGGVVAVVGLLVALAVGATRNTRALGRLEPPRRPAAGEARHTSVAHRASTATTA